MHVSFGSPLKESKSTAYGVGVSVSKRRLWQFSKGYYTHMCDSLENYGLGFCFFFPGSLLHPFLHPSLFFSSIFPSSLPFILLFVFMQEKHYKGILERIFWIALLWIEVILLMENGKLEASTSMALFRLLKIQCS